MEDIKESAGKLLEDGERIYKELSEEDFRIAEIYANDMNNLAHDVQGNITLKSMMLQMSRSELTHIEWNRASNTKFTLGKVQGITILELGTILAHTRRVKEEGYYKDLRKQKGRVKRVFKEYGIL